jgi:hypothetical protein
LIFATRSIARLGEWTRPTRLYNQRVQPKVLMIYTQLLDSESCVTEADWRAGGELLKLNILTKKCPTIPLVLVTDSPLFLSDSVAGNSAVHELIGLNYLKFPRWGNARTLVEAFANQLEDPEYIVNVAWLPKGFAEPRCRENAAKHLRNRGIAPPREVEKELDYIRRLSSTIDCAAKHTDDGDTRRSMADHMAALIERIAAYFEREDVRRDSDRDKALEAILLLGKSNPKLASRSRLYKWYQSHPTLSEASKKIVRDHINVEWNKNLAKCSGYIPLHTVSQSGDSDPLMSADEARACTIEQVTDERFAGDLFRSFSWEDIRDAMKDSDAHQLLADRYAQGVVDDDMMMLYRFGTAGEVRNILSEAHTKLHMKDEPKLQTALLATGELAVAITRMLSGFVRPRSVPLEKALEVKKRILMRRVKEKLAGYLMDADWRRGVPCGRA